MQTQKDIKTIAIFGSCVSRDNFNRLFNEDYKEDFQVVLLENQTSILSLMAPKISHDEYSLDPLKDLDRETTLTELDKSFLPTLKSLRPDMLIIDFFADARFKTIAHKDSFFTANEWKNTKTNIYKEMEKDAVPFFPTEEQLRENMQRLYAFCKQHLPEMTIILNKARAVESFKNRNGELEYFSKELVKNINQRWDYLDHLWLSLFPDTLSIDAMRLDTKGDIDHPLGNGYVHYTKPFYHDFLFALRIGLEDDHIEKIKALLAKLQTNNNFPKDKAKEIKEIYFRYGFLSEEQKASLAQWIDGRYEPMLQYILLYEKSVHKRIDFAYDMFRWGKTGICARDIDFAHYLIEPIVNKEIGATKDTLDYALFAYGTIMYDRYKESIDSDKESLLLYQKALEALMTSSKAKSLYLQQRSHYFLAQLYGLKKSFNKGLVAYTKAISLENTLANQYPLIFSLLMLDLKIDLNGIFKDVDRVFSKENVENLGFWKLLLEQIPIDPIQKNIKKIIDFGPAEKNDVLNGESIQEVTAFCERLIRYYECITKEDSCNLRVLQSLYNDELLSNKGKSHVLLAMGEIDRDVHGDLNRAMLMFCESIDLYLNKDNFHRISDLVLSHFSNEIREILKDATHHFRSPALQKYLYEQPMGKSAWRRFENNGFVSGDFDEEIDFLEYLYQRAKSEKLKTLVATRLAFLYYKGHAGIRIHDYNKPNYHRAQKLFETLGDNPLVAKYLKRPILSIYNAIETVKDDEHYMFFENKQSDRLIIVFACAFGYAHYSQLYTFYQKNKTNVLFLNNPEYNWYHGSEWERIKRTIDSIVVDRFDKRNVICYFGSMGGYAALKTGLTYGFKSIVFNPQIDMNIWIKHRPVLAPRLRDEKELVNIQDFNIQAFESAPIYYLTSSSIEDVEAFSIFIKKISQCKNGLFIIEKIPDNTHPGIFAKVYKEHQQDAIIAISQLMDRYFPQDDYDKITHEIPTEQQDAFWGSIIGSMEVRLIIQIIDKILFAAEIKENFTKKTKLSKYEFVKTALRIVS